MGLLLLLGAPTFAADTNAPPRVEVDPTGPAWVAGYRLRWPLRLAGTWTNPTPLSVIAQVPTGGWLNPDASDIVVQGSDGTMLPVRVLSHNPTGNTIIQFPRQGTNRWYWAYGVNPNAPPLPPEPVVTIPVPVPASAATNLTGSTTNQTSVVTNQVVAVRSGGIPEGLTMEVREWAGERLDSWADAVAGLHQSETVIGNAVVPEVVHRGNPFRPTNSRKFAISYRGYLNLTNSGAYRFLVNADDAAFLFIDGFKVFERPGANLALTGKIPVGSGGGLIDLTNGVHAIEVHHVMGNAPQGEGTCGLGWIPPGEKRWAIVPRTAFATAAWAITGPPAEAAGAAVAGFQWGLDEPLLVSGLNLFLMRFEAQGKLANPDALVWDLGDGSTRKGRSFRHTYLSAGEYKVTLKSADGLPLHTRRVYAWPILNGEASPLSLPRIAQSFRDLDWKKYDFALVYRIYQFLDAAALPDAWPLLEAVCLHLLAQPAQDQAVRAGVYRSLMVALAEQSRAAEAVAVGTKAVAEFATADSLQVVVRLALGDVQFRFLKDADASIKQYQEIINKFAKLDAPEVRLAAIRLGDVALELGDQGGAAEAYRLAARLGGRQFQTSELMDTVTHGAQLRIVEQRLRAGSIAECRALMQKIELETPEQKLQGYYTLLRAEVDRTGGRYEAAIGGYQRVLSQVQWSGFHDRATFGIADCHLRQGQFAKAQVVLDKLKEAFPKFWEKEKLADYASVVSNRLARVTAPPPVAADAPKRFDLAVQPWDTGFEPEEPAGYDWNAQSFPCVLSQGLKGSHVLLMDNVPVSKGYCDWYVRVTNLSPGAWIWGEGWYRDWEGSRMFQGSHAHLYTYDAAMVGGGPVTVGFDATHGQWHKFGMLIKAPTTADGTFFIPFRYPGAPHLTEIDGISISQVTDRQVEALQNFIRQREAAGQ